MSNMSLYNYDHDDDIGPAPAGPAESAHNMTLQFGIWKEAEFYILRAVLVRKKKEF